MLKILLRLAITEYIHQLQSFEEYAFSWKELLNSCNKTETSLKRELSRLVDKKEIINLRKEFLMNIEEKEKNSGFTGDMEALLRSGITYNQEVAFEWLKNELIEKI